MERAWQTPHGARPNREEARLRPGACRLGAPNLRVGRLSRAVMRGPEEWPSCRSDLADRIRLTGPAASNIGLSGLSTVPFLRHSPAARLRLSPRTIVAPC